MDNLPKLIEEKAFKLFCQFGKKTNNSLEEFEDYVMSRLQEKGDFSAEFIKSIKFFPDRLVSKIQIGEERFSSGFVPITFKSRNATFRGRIFTACDDEQTRELIELVESLPPQLVGEAKKLIYLKINGLRLNDNARKWLIRIKRAYQIILEEEQRVD